MELENRTKLNAELARSVLPSTEKQQMLVTVVAKARGLFDSQGRMKMDWETPIPVIRDPLPMPKGEIPSDVALRKAGVDVMALGDAYHPSMHGGTSSTVSVQVNGDRRDLAVFGNRVWYKKLAGTWAISDPIPFSLMAMTWQKSYGGISFDDEGNEVAYAINPEGHGYIGCKDAIDDTSLPNVEDPSQLIRNWNDQPRPSNICPAPKHISNEMDSFKDDVEKASSENPYIVPDSLWNDAVPKFRFSSMQPGQQVVLTGMSERPLTACTPAVTLQIEALIGDKRKVLPLALDTILFMPSFGLCTFAWRAGLIYDFVPKDSRRLVLTSTPATGGAP